MERPNQDHVLVSENFGIDFWVSATPFFDRNEAINDNVNLMTRRHAVDISIEILSNHDTKGQARRGPKHKYRNDAVYKKMETWLQTYPMAGYEAGIAKLIGLYAEAGIDIQEDSAKRYYYALKAGRRPGLS